MTATPALRPEPGLYGYPDADHMREMRLREITIALPPGELREVAAFLMQAAEAIEQHPRRAFWHIHVDEVVRGWRTRHPRTDIVVLDLRGYGAE